MFARATWQNDHLRIIWLFSLSPNQHLEFGHLIRSGILFMLVAALELFVDRSHRAGVLQFVCRCSSAKLSVDILFIFCFCKKVCRNNIFQVFGKGRNFRHQNFCQLFWKVYSSTIITILNMFMHNIVCVIFLWSSVYKILNLNSNIYNYNCNSIHHKIFHFESITSFM